MNLLEYADNVEAVKLAGGIATCGDHLMQPDDGSTASPVPKFYDDVWTYRTLWFTRDIATGTTVAPPPWANSTTGTGAAVAGLTEDAHPEYFNFKSGTTLSGRAGRVYTPAVCFDTAGHLWRYDAIARINTLSTTAQEHNVTAGFTDAPTVIAAVDGAYVTIDSKTAANFQCTTSSNSTRTTTDSGLAAVAGTLYRIVIDVSDVTNVLFRIYAITNAYPASATVTTTSNIPTGTARATAAAAVLLKSVGTTSVTVDFLYQMVTQDRLAA